MFARWIWKLCFFFNMYPDINRVVPGVSPPSSPHGRAIPVALHPGRIHLRSGDAVDFTGGSLLLLFSERTEIMNTSRQGVRVGVKTDQCRYVGMLRVRVFGLTTCNEFQSVWLCRVPDWNAVLAGIPHSSLNPG